MLASVHRILLLVIAASFLGSAWGQRQTPPSCALECLVGALGPDTCVSPTDTKCICTNAAFQGKVAECVVLTCTIPEALVARNASLTACGAPVRDRAPQYRVLSNVMISVASVFVVTRFVFKLFIAQLDLGWDDWTILATLIAAIPSAFITIYGTLANGLGKDIWTLPPQQITLVLEYFYIMAWLYFLQVTLVKLALLFFFLRIFPAKPIQRVLWATIGFTSAWGACFIILAIFQCRPISYFWTRWDGLHEGKCLNINAITDSHAGISIALDLWMLAIPLWQLRLLRMHWKKKIGVAMMFCVGTFVTAVSILRLRALVHFAASDNVTWEFYDVSMWSSIEICVGLMCACMPTLRMLLVRFFPILTGGSGYYRSGARKYYHYGSSGARLEEINAGSRSKLSKALDSRGGGSSRADRSATDESDLQSPREGVIVVETSIYQTARTQKLQQGQGDEASWVRPEWKGGNAPREGQSFYDASH